MSQSNEARAVGVIGLGAMGAGIAQSLRRGGCRVHAYDIRPGVAAAFAEQGGAWLARRWRTWPPPATSWSAWW